MASGFRVLRLGLLEPEGHVTKSPELLAFSWYHRCGHENYKRSGDDYVDPFLQSLATGGRACTNLMTSEYPSPLLI